MCFWVHLGPSSGPSFESRSGFESCLEYGYGSCNVILIKVRVPIIDLAVRWGSF